MAVLKTDGSPRGAKPAAAVRGPLALVAREFDALVRSYETGLLRSLAAPDRGHLHDRPRARRRDSIQREACRLALAELSAAYTRKQILRSLHAAESLGKLAEEQLHAAAAHHLDSPLLATATLATIPNGHFRLYSTELFDLLGQPVDLRLGSLRFHTTPPHGHGHGPYARTSRPTSVELALNSSFFVAESDETLPYHCFTMPETPSLMNRGILSRKPEDGGAFPEYDSWLLFTFLGNGCLKVEIPIEMCADVYGGNLRGRENEEVVFWGLFIEDEAIE